MLPIQSLSNAVLFSEITTVQWAESKEWDIIYPDVNEFTVDEIKKIFPRSQIDGEEALKKQLSSYFEDQQEIFEPRESYCIKLRFDRGMAVSQAILYKAHNPCKIIDLDGCPVLTCPGDIWAMQDVFFRAFLLLGFIPPFILHDSYGLESQFSNSKDKCQHFIQRSIDALLYEYRALSESMS